MSVAERQAVATTLAFGKPEDVGMSPQQLRRVRELARGWVVKGLVQGLVALVARRGQIVVYEPFGRQLPDEDSPPVALDSIFPIASITKIFTTTAIMMLVEEARVGLNRRVREYIPEFAGEGKDGVLVRHLLTHTSGIGEDQLEAFAMERKGITIPSTEATLHPLMSKYLIQRYECPLWKPPGAEMSYADFNFDLAGEIVRRVTGKSLSDFARMRIFEPLGMRNTHYCRVEVPRHRRAWRGPDAEDPWRETIETEPIVQGSGRTWSSAMDMAIFCQMFLNRGAYGDFRILSPASVAEMTRNQIPGISSTFLNETFPEASWGLGWSIHGTKTGLCGTLYSPEAFEHWGAGGTYIWADPVYDLVGIYCAVAPNPHTDAGKAMWRNDVFTDAVTAAVADQVTAPPITPMREVTTLRSGAPEDAGVSPERVRQIWSVATDWVDQGRAGALVVLAARHGVIFLHEAFGRRSPEPGAPPVALGTIFPLASISKAITATALMTLVDEGQVGLNRLVADYIPEFTGGGRAAVQVHHLLTHTSGLRDEDLEAHAAAKKDLAGVPPDDGGMPPFLYEHLAPLWDAPLFKPPGAEMAYSGYNYRLLGEIVRRVSGRSLAAFAQARIFEPLGMIDSSYGLAQALVPRLVLRGPAAHEPDLDTPIFRQRAWGSAGVFSTARDMAIFGQMFLNGGVYGDQRILSPPSVAAMTHDWLPGIQARIVNEFFPEASWGLGWSIHGRKTGWCGGLYSPQAYEHWGSGGVYLWVDPTYDVVGAYFSVIPVPEADPGYTELQDLFTDAVTAAIVE